MFELSFWLLLAITIFTWMLVPKTIKPTARFPLLVFCGAYAVTYAIGAIAIGWSESTLEEFLYEIWTPTARAVGPLYWVMVFAPLIVTPLVTVLGGRFIEDAPSDDSPPERLSLISWLVLFGALSYYALSTLIEKGSLSTAAVGLLLNAAGDTDVMYELREDTFGGQTTMFFGIIYQMLPYLSLAALFQASRENTRRWWGIFGISAAIVVSAGVATYQIMIPTVYILSVLFGLLALGRLRLKPVPVTISGLLVFVFLQISHYIKFGSITVLGGLTHYFLRMPCALTYYLWLFPNVVPHTGMTLLGDFTGLRDADPAHPYTVGSIMYSQSDNVTLSPAIPAPSHVNAYADAGLLYSFFVLFLVGVLIVAIARFDRRMSRSPWGFALRIQAYVLLYFLTQTSVRSAVVQSYGINWSIVAGVALLAMHPQIFLKGRRR